MASIYLELRQDYVNKRGEQAIRLVVVADGKATPQNTGYSIPAKYWDSGTRQVKGNYPNAANINKAITDKLNDAVGKFADLDTEGSTINAKKILSGVNVGSNFKEIAYHYAALFRKDGKIGTADNYENKADKINTLFPNLKARQMDAAWADEFRAKVKNTYAPNTIVSYLKFANSILVKAEKDNIIKKNNLEKARKGSYRPPVKLKATIADIHTMWQTEPFGKWERYAKYTFLFSYYASGARFKDVLLMENAFIYMEGKQQRLRWMPNKTEETAEEMIDTPVHAKLKAIIKEFNSDSKSIFGLIPDIYLNSSIAVKLASVKNNQEREALLVELATAQDRELSNTEAVINKYLKLFIARCKIEKQLTFHDARRALSKHLREATGDIYGIKDVLGHANIATTQGYVGRDQKGADKLLGMLYK